MNGTLFVKRAVLLVLFGLAVCELVMAQGKEMISVDWVYSDQADRILAIPTHKWLDDGTLLLYDSRVEKAKRTFETYDPKSGRRRIMLDMPKALANLKSLVKDQDTLLVLPWPEACDGRAKRALYIYDNDIFMLDLPSATFRRLTQTEAEEKCPRFSPDGQYFGFVRENDLYVYDIAHESERRLTKDGSESLLNGTLPWLYWEEIFNRVDMGYWWSSDSRTIAFLQTDQSHVDTMYFVEFDTVSPTVKKQYYPRPGMTNPTVTLAIVDVDNEHTVRMDLPTDSYEYIVGVTWFPQCDRLAVLTMDRTQNRVDMHLVNRTDGSTVTMLTETDSAWVNPSEPYLLSDGRHFLWLSERDGFAHLYQYTTDGKLVNRVTDGDWKVMPTLSFSHGGQSHAFAVDEKQGSVYFMATEKSPIERHLYHAKLDGSSLGRLTSESGTHVVSFSPDLKYYLDQHSNLTSMPTLSLHRNDGTAIDTLAASRPELLNQFNLQYPVVTTVPTPDGLSLPCMLTRPSDFDSSNKYPVILEVYGGPSAPIVTDAWRGQAALLDQTLLDKGFILMSCDNRSSATVSKTEAVKVKGHLWGEVELTDLMTAVHWLKEQPWVDPARIGIWGWSGGGTYTILAMTHTTEFKAGIAGAPVTDWRYYDTKYTEAYMKRPEDNAAGYSATSLVTAAGNLHGRLLLMHGVSDDNVHIEHSWAFVDELVKAGKTLDMMIYPLRKHGFEDKPSQIHRRITMNEFWIRNL